LLWIEEDREVRTNLSRRETDVVFNDLYIHFFCCSIEFYFKSIINS
jgi:hypothetical protein